MEKIIITVYKISNDQRVFFCCYNIDSDVKYEIRRESDVFCILKYIKSNITKNWLPPREVFLGNTTNFYIKAQ